MMGLEDSSAEVQSILDYLSALHDKDVAENLTNFLGDSSEVDAFTKAYMSWRKAGGTAEFTMPASDTAVAHKEPSKKVHEEKEKKKPRQSQKVKSAMKSKSPDPAPAPILPTPVPSAEHKCEAAPPPAPPAAPVPSANEEASVVKKPQRVVVVKAPIVKGKATIVCGCFGTVHPVVLNCLLCGRLICEIETSGFCPFCSNSITPRAKSKGKGKGKVSKEEAHKDRLLMFDREAASRTTVFDDQADYFQNSSSMWLEEKEREDAERIDKEKRKEMHERSSSLKGALSAVL